ncbi:DUF2236 domain-containing protein [Flavobacteriaceae bacterium Ap0902]|nr:DUF2236 domain-containing protein [Flavobacteriaceae bacterium Ap0902]
MKKNSANDVFWTSGNGKDFLEWANISLDDLKQKDTYSPELFYEYDEQVDELTSKWLQNGDFKKIMQSLHQSESNPSELPLTYLNWKERFNDIPGWVDMELIEQGCNLSERSGLNGLLVLRNFALLGGYNFVNLTKPLVVTGALEKGAVHRLYYTLNFWIEVSRNGVNSQQRRREACIQTRLVHAVSRLNILKKQPDWNQDLYGVPINFADMVATNIAFTVYYLYGLDRLNFSYTAAEEAGIFHLWKYVTYLLGVPLDMIPNNKEEAIAYFYFWTQYQGSPDQDSLKLVQALLEENTPIELLKLDIIKRNMSYIHHSIANYLIDEKIRRDLEIPPVRFSSIIPKAIKMKNSVHSGSKDAQIREGRKQQASILEDYKNRASKTYSEFSK